MNPWETLTMSQKEAPRIGLLKALVARRVTGREVALALDVTVRQVGRLKPRFQAAGGEGPRNPPPPAPRPAPAPGAPRQAPPPAPAVSGPPRAPHPHGRAGPA